MNGWKKEKDRGWVRDLMTNRKMLKFLYCEVVGIWD